MDYHCLTLKWAKQWVRIVFGLILMATATSSFGASYVCEVPLANAEVALKKCKTGDKLVFTNDAGLPGAVTWVLAGTHCDPRYAVVLQGSIGFCIYSEEESKRLTR